MDGAIALYSDFIDKSPDDVELHLKLGIACEYQGYLTQAAQHYKRAMELRPGFSGAQQNYANILSAQGRVSDAMDAYLAAIEADPQWAEGHLTHGYALQHEDQTSAYRAFRRAAELDPSNYLATYFCGADLHIGRPRAEAFEIVAVFDGPADCEAPHAWLRHEALRHLQRAVQLNPKFCYGWMALGWGHLELCGFDVLRTASGRVRRRRFPSELPPPASRPG